MTTKAPPLTEKQFQQNIIDLAHVLQWKVAHFRPALTNHGWRTPVQADGAGFPDLVLVRERLVMAELKTQTKPLTLAQIEWREALLGAGVEMYLWRPGNWDEIVAVLQRRNGGAS